MRELRRGFGVRVGARAHVHGGELLDGDSQAREAEPLRARPPHETRGAFDRRPAVRRFRNGTRGVPGAVRVPRRVDAPERRRVPRRLGRARGVLRAVGLRQLRQDRGDVERRCRVEHLQRRGLRALPGALRRFAAQSRRLRRRRVFVAESVKRGVGAGEDAQRPAESESRRGFFRCRTRSAFGVGRSANGLSGRARGSRHGRAGGRDPRPAGAPAERRRVHPAGRLQLDVGARRFEKTRAPTAVRRRRERRGR